MGIFRHLPNDIIEINGEQFDLELFLEIEPEYTIPKDINFCRIRFGKSSHIIF